MNKNNLPNNLYELRRAANLSQEEFAERLGVSRQAVSKWERGEAYPDTENLIAISDIFGISIDELLRADNIAASQSSDTDKSSTDSESDNGYFRASVNDTVKVNLNGGITINDDDGEVKVVLGEDGIVVNAGDSSKVKFGKHGIRIMSKDNDDDDYEDYESNGIYVGKQINTDTKDEDSKSSRLAIFYKLPYPVIVTVAFLFIGLSFGGWYWAWTLFITIPIYYSLLDSIRKRRLTEFAYPVFIAFLYCLFGMLYTLWHPGWIIFLTIPIYDPIARSIDRWTKK